MTRESEEGNSDFRVQRTHIFDMFYFLILEIPFQKIQIDIRWNRIDEIQFTMLTLD